MLGHNLGVRRACSGACTCAPSPDTVPPRALFRLQRVRRSQFFWDVSPDGQRFLVNIPAEQNPAASLALVVNWPSLINQSERGR